MIKDLEILENSYYNHIYIQYRGAIHVCYEFAIVQIPLEKTSLGNEQYK